MRKILKIALFILVPGIFIAAINSILEQTQSLGTSFIIDASIGLIFIVLRLLVKGKLWGDS